MLRPANRTIEQLYYAYLRFCLWFTGFVFRSGQPALKCKDYFIQALQMFYSAQELNDMLEDVGFRDVTNKTVFYGMLGFHRAVKPAADPAPGRTGKRHSPGSTVGCSGNSAAARRPACERRCRCGWRCRRSNRCSRIMSPRKSARMRW